MFGYFRFGGKIKMEQCPKCKTKYAKFPYKDEQGKFIWKNFIKMDLVSVMFLIAIVFMTYAYYHDTEACRDILENPIESCERIGCDCTMQKGDDTQWQNLQPSNITFTLDG